MAELFESKNSFFSGEKFLSSLQAKWGSPVTFTGRIDDTIWGEGYYKNTSLLSHERIFQHSSALEKVLMMAYMHSTSNFDQDEWLNLKVGEHHVFSFIFQERKNHCAFSCKVFISGNAGRTSAVSTGATITEAFSTAAGSTGATNNVLQAPV